MRAKLPVRVMMFALSFGFAGAALRAPTKPHTSWRRWKSKGGQGRPSLRSRCD